MKKISLLVLGFGLLSLGSSVLAQPPADPLDEKAFREAFETFEKANENEFYGLKPLRLGCEKPGVELGVGTPGRSVLMHPSPHYIQLKHAQGKARLEDLNQLKGWIEVRDAQTALRVVRLRSAPNTNALWSGPKEAEIVQAGAEPALPDYGLEQHYLYCVRAVFAKPEYARQGYTSPRVEKVRDGYRITRWLLVCQFRYTSRDLVRDVSVQKVQEWIGEDGGYERKVLSTRPAAPSLHYLFPFRE